MDKETVIAQTEKWIREVVIGCNFCPFAAREVQRGSLWYEVPDGNNTTVVLAMLSDLCIKMDREEAVETVFLILPGGFSSFAAYLKLVTAAEKRLKGEGYEGVYQLASFHPGYLFAGNGPGDPANYTNRSPYPMLQVLRERSVSRAVDSYPGTGAIPQNNIRFARSKGLAWMQALRAASLKSNP